VLVIKTDRLRLDAVFEKENKPPYPKHAFLNLSWITKQKA